MMMNEGYWLVRVDRWRAMHRVGGRFSGQSAKDQSAPTGTVLNTPIGRIGPLAQLVEQETLNLLVRGSSPRGPTILITGTG